MSSREAPIFAARLSLQTSLQPAVSWRRKKLLEQGKNNGYVYKYKIEATNTILFSVFDLLCI